jgi:hypothetical protein
MSGNICLTGFPQEGVSFWSWRFRFSLISEALGFVCQPIRKGQGVLKATTLHDITSLLTGPNP